MWLAALRARTTRWASLRPGLLCRALACRGPRKPVTNPLSTTRKRLEMMAVVDLTEREIGQKRASRAVGLEKACETTRRETEPMRTRAKYHDLTNCHFGHDQKSSGRARLGSMRIDCRNCGRLVYEPGGDGYRGVLKERLCWSCYRFRARRGQLPSKSRLEEAITVKLELKRRDAKRLRLVASALYERKAIDQPSLAALFIHFAALFDVRDDTKRAETLGGPSKT